MQVCAVQDHVPLIKNVIAPTSAESLKIQRPERLQFTQSWGYLMGKISPGMGNLMAKSKIAEKI